MFHDILLNYPVCEVLPGYNIMAYVGLRLNLLSFLNLALD